MKAFPDIPVRAEHTDMQWPYNFDMISQNPEKELTNAYFTKKMAYGLITLLFPLQAIRSGISR